MARSSGLALWLLAAGLLAAGCGGGGDPAETATASITKAELIKKGDQICSKGGKQSEREYAAFVKAHGLQEGKEPSAAQFAEIGKAILIPLLEQQVREIRALGAPPGDKAEVDEFLSAVEETIEGIEKNPKSAKSPSTALKEPFELAGEYGFKVCGNG